MGRVYGEKWRSLFARNIAVSPVTAVNKAEQHLTLKLAALIFNQLNHCLLKCKLYLSLHVQFFFFFFFFFLPKHHLSLLLPFLPVNRFCHCNIPNRRTHTHTHTQTQTQTQIACLMKKMYLKHVQILENVVNICIINDLSYPPANNQNAFFYYPTRGLSTAPADITAIIITAQISTASLGCEVAKLRGQMG